MSFFEEFPIKGYDEVCNILEETGYHQVIEEIIQIESGYFTRRLAHQLGPLPTYKFAIACALASLGNYRLAEYICSLPENFMEPGWGDNISRDLANRFMVAQS